MSDANASTTQDTEPERGFQIRGRFYPEPAGEKLGDPAIIREVTGLKWDDYQAAFGLPDPAVDPDDQEPTEVDDSLVLAGMVALAVAHANPGWNRSRVVSFVSQLDSVAVELIGFDVEPDHVDEAEEALPPTSANGSDSAEPPEPTTASGDPTPDATAELSAERQD